MIFIFSRFVMTCCAFFIKTLSLNSERKTNELITSFDLNLLQMSFHFLSSNAASHFTLPPALLLADREVIFLYLKKALLWKMHSKSWQNLGKIKSRDSIDELNDSIQFILHFVHTLFSLSMFLNRPSSIASLWAEHLSLEVLLYVFCFECNLNIFLIQMFSWF